MFIYNLKSPKYNGTRKMAGSGNSTPEKKDRAVVLWG